MNLESSPSPHMHFFYEQKDSRAHCDLTTCVCLNTIQYTIYDAMVFNFANCCNKMCITPFCNRNFFLHTNACKRMRLSAVSKRGNPITLATSIFHEREYIFLNWKPSYSRQNNQKGCWYLWEIMIQTKISWARLSITLQTRKMPFVGRHRLSKAAG